MDAIIPPNADYSNQRFEYPLEDLLAYGAIFRRAIFTAEIRNCVFVGCSFLGAEFRDVEILGTDFLYGDLREIKAIGSKLQRSTIALASLRNANLSRCSIIGCNILDSDVTGTVLDDCPIRRCRLARLDFRGSVVRRLRLTETVIADCLWPEDVGPRAFQDATILEAASG